MFPNNIPVLRDMSHTQPTLSHIFNIGKDGTSLMKSQLSVFINFNTRITKQTSI